MRKLVFSTEERTFKSSGKVAEKFLDIVFKNNETGMEATISGRSLKKMLSGKAWKKSVSLQAHLAAVERKQNLQRGSDENKKSRWKISVERINPSEHHRLGFIKSLHQRLYIVNKNLLCYTFDCL